MNLVPVTSSDLRAVGYDADTQTLQISFKDGGLYEYKYVSESMHRDLMSASSKGKFFSRYLRDKTAYPCRKIHG